MAPSPAGLTRRRAFTLIEVLIALALTSVVMGLAWIVLDSTRKVTLEIDKPIEDTTDIFWQQIQWELDRLLSSPVNTKTPPLRFSPERGLEMVALLPDRNGIPLQTELHYVLKDTQLMKIRKSGFPPAAQTNLLSETVQAFLPTVEIDAESFSSWPPEKNSPPPPLLQLRLLMKDGQSTEREFYLPAAFRVEKAGAETETDGIDP